jgi:hypothetical protein
MSKLFKKAKKQGSKLRLAIFGPAGAGKTYTALSIAAGLKGCGDIGMVDTEYGSASKYADVFDFQTTQLEKANIDNLVNIFRIAEKENIEVLIVDSLSHAWHELLSEVDRLAKSKYRGNSFRAWSEGTPKQKKIIEAIHKFNGHLIATMRSKTEWVIEENSKGKMAPQRVGLSPDQGKNIEFEFDMLIDMNPEHYGQVLKDRTGKYQDKVLNKPGKEFGIDLKNWLSGFDNQDLEKEAVRNKEKLSKDKSKVDLNKGRKSLAEPRKTQVEQMKDSLKDEIGNLDLFKSEMNNLEQQINEAESVRDLYTVKAIIKDRSKVQNSSNSNLEKLQKMVQSGLDSLKQKSPDEWNENHVINSLKKHLGTVSVKGCKDISKLRKYLKHLRDEYRKIEKGAA